MTKQVRVNVRTAIDSAGIRRERRNGRDYIVVPSATLPDDIVMNRVRYPAAAIAKSFGSLENTPAPLGHPTIEGAFVSASDPEGLARGWIGAWNRNVRRENGRVLVDKVIDVATATQLEGGKMVLNAIEHGEPIHTSTGLYAILHELQNDEHADFEASDIVFDHDAILLGEEGAATPSQGVGMLVNSAKSKDGLDAVEVINSAIDDAERDLDWASDSALRAVERIIKAPLLERIKDAIKEVVLGASAPEVKTTEENVLMNEEQFNSLSGKVDALVEGLGGIGEQIAAAVSNAVKPITDHMQAQADAQQAKAETEKADLVNKVVNAGLLDEDAAKTADVAVLNALIEKNKPGQATVLNGAFKVPAGGAAAYKLPEGD